MSALAISFDPLRVDRARVHRWLSQEAYWSIGIGRTDFDRAVDHSLVASAYLGDEQVGFARVVTDHATFAWLCDVFVAPPARGQGVGTRLVAAFVAHPELQGQRRWGLRTRDAHALYERFGFTALAEPQRAMERHNPHVYTPPASATAADRSTP
jgi:GNAT superfamily N-acetyltransferase